MLVKDVEKVIGGNHDAGHLLRSKLESLPDNVVVIGSHTHLDSRKEKASSSYTFMAAVVPAYYDNLLTNMHLYLQTHPGGLLFTKFGGNPTTLLDLAFPVCTNYPYSPIFFSFGSRC